MYIYIIYNHIDNHVFLSVLWTHISNIEIGILKRLVQKLKYGFVQCWLKLFYFFIGCSYGAPWCCDQHRDIVIKVNAYKDGDLELSPNELLSMLMFEKNLPIIWVYFIWTYAWRGMTEAVKLRFGIVIRKLDFGSDKWHAFVTMIYERSGQYKKSIWKLKRDDTRTRKYGCSFNLHGYDKANNTLTFNVICMV